MSETGGRTSGDDAEHQLQPTYRTLLVDDEPAFLHAAALALDGHSRIVVVGQVTSGAAALSVLPSLAPDAVLLDIQMPAMHGFAVARALRTLAPAVLIVLTSTTDDAAYAAAARQVGAAFLPKRQLSPAAFLALLDGAGRA